MSHRSVHRSGGRQGGGRIRHGYVDMQQYDSIEEVVRLALQLKWDGLSNPLNTSAVWNRLSQLINVPDQFQICYEEDRYRRLLRNLESLLRDTLRGLGDYEPKPLTQTALAVAKLLRIVFLHYNGYARNLHRMFHDLLAERRFDIFEAIAAAAVPLLPEFDPQGHSNLAYACFNADVVPEFDGSNLFEHIARAVVALQHLGDFKPQELSNIVYAYAMVGVPSPPLFEKVAREVIEGRRLGAFKPVELSNMARAFATADPVAGRSLLEEVASEVANRELESFDQKHLCNFASAFAKADVTDKCLVEDVEAELDRRSTALFAKKYDDIFEIVQDALEFTDDTLSPSRALAAVWTRLSQLIHAEDQCSARGGDPVDGHYGPIEYNRHPRLDKELKALVKRTIGGLKDCGTIQLSETTMSMAKIIKAVQNKGSEDRHGRYVANHHKVFHDVLVGRNSKKKDGIFEVIASVAVPLLPQFDAQGYSNLAYACAIADAVPEFEGCTLFDHIARAVDTSEHFLRDFTPQNLSNIVWAFSTAKVFNSRLYDKVAYELLHYRDLDSFDPQHLSNTVWAYAKAGVADQGLFDKVAHTVADHHELRSLATQDLSMFFWAFAKADLAHPSVFDKLASAVVDGWDSISFDPQSLTNLVWAFATVKISNSRLFERVATEVVDCDLSSFKAINLALIAWAFAKANIHNRRLFEKVATEYTGRDMGLYDSQNLATFVWSFAASNQANPALLDTVATEVIRRDLRSVSFPPRHLSMIAWAFAAANTSHTALFKGMMAAMMERNYKFTMTQHISTTIWACAICGHLDSQFFKAMAPTVVGVLNKCENQELANIAWSYAVADVDDPTLFNSSFVKAISERIDNFNTIELRQLYQWHLWQTEEKSNTGLPPALEKLCYETSLSEQLHTVSLFQRDVIHILKDIGLHPKQEVMTKIGYSLDAMVAVDGKEFAIEVDGPSHFNFAIEVDEPLKCAFVRGRPKGRTPNGSTMLKRRQISNIEGIALIPIPYWEWDEPGQVLDKKRNYLCSLLGIECGSFDRSRCTIYLGDSPASASPRVISCSQDDGDEAVHISTHAPSVNVHHFVPDIESPEDHEGYAKAQKIDTKSQRRLHSKETAPKERSSRRKHSCSTKRKRHSRKASTKSTSRRRRGHDSFSSSDGICDSSTSSDASHHHRRRKDSRNRSSSRFSSSSGICGSSTSSDTSHHGRRRKDSRNCSSSRKRKMRSMESSRKSKSQRRRKYDSSSSSKSSCDSSVSSDSSRHHRHRKVSREDSTVVLMKSQQDSDHSSSTEGMRLMSTSVSYIQLEKENERLRQEIREVRDAQMQLESEVRQIQLLLSKEKGKS